MFKNKALRTKLLSSFMLLILITVITGAVGYWGTQFCFGKSLYSG